MSAGKLCANCPFRVGSPLGYDADAMEALDAGHEPSCHEVVGLDAVMTGGPDERCLGYEAWCDGKRGFQKPALVGANDGRP
jgi:hypothetical protein